MARIAFFLFATGCIGTRNVEPNWEYVDVDETAIEGCGEDDTGSANGFSISGDVQDMLSLQAPTNPGPLCAYALNPTPVLAGNEPEVMAGAAVCEDGSYKVSGLTDPPSIGMFISIADCDETTLTVMKSATGVDFDDVKDLGDGDTLGNQVAYLVTLELGQSIDQGLVDFEGDAVETGFMAGFILDAAGQPVSGGMVSCGECADFYYMDADDSDGLFSTNGERNTSTDIATGSVFVAPAAPIFTYEATDDGSHTWDSQLFGSLPGYASFLLFNALN